MSLDFIVFITFYFIAIISTIGFGLLFEKIFNLTDLKFNLGFTGISGLLFLIVYSYISHLFTSHGILHNFIINLIGLTSFFLLIKNKKKEELKLSILIFIILFSCFLLFKTHDDFPYYHFPYTYHLTQNSLVFGTGLLNHGFRTPSSIFYLNSLFYLPLIKSNLFQIGALLISGFSILSLLEDIKKNLKIKDIDKIFFLRLFSIIFILIFFYRLQEHGTDRSAQILILLFIIELFALSKNYNHFNIYSSKVIILFTLIIGLKLFFLLYFIFVIPIIYYFYKANKTYLLGSIFKNKLFYLSLLSLTFYIFTYFANTGCLFYPVSISCFDSFSWSIPIDVVDKLKLHYENWAKAGSGVGYDNIDKENYVKFLNWLPNWLDKYFFNKVSDFLLGLIFLNFTLILIFCKKNVKKYYSDTNYKLIYFIVLLLFVEWFFNHPALRYGGYAIIALMFFIPFSHIIDTFKSTENLDKKVFIIIIISFMIFSFRNFARISKEVKIYNFDFLNKPYYYLDESHYRIENRILSMVEDYEKCLENENNCNKEIGTKKIILRSGIYIITRDAQ